VIVFTSYTSDSGASSDCAPCTSSRASGVASPRRCFCRACFQLVLGLIELPAQVGLVAHDLVQLERLR
jgi:hypothetical protein